jgi:hypothetical protein
MCSRHRVGLELIQQLLAFPVILFLGDQSLLPKLLERP